MTSIAMKGNTVRSKIHPHKFALWVGCASIVMMFAGLTSAYTVRKAAGNWLEFELPSVFYVSTVFIILSSIALQIALQSFKRNKEVLYKVSLLGSMVLGFGFLVSQYQGWQALYNMGIAINTNPSGSFLYVLSGIHAAHLIGGIAVLTVALIHAFGLVFKPTPKRILRLELTATYWHFVDLLWVYLLLFLPLQ